MLRVEQAFLKRLRTISPYDFLKCEILISLKERINSLGYFDSESFSAIANKGGFFLSRYFRSVALYSAEEKKGDDKIDLVKTLRGVSSNVVDIPNLLINTLCGHKWKYT